MIRNKRIMGVLFALAIILCMLPIIIRQMQLVPLR